MPQIEIRPANPFDIAALVNIEHHYSSDYVWQMEFLPEETQVAVTFRQVRLPRSAKVEYPRPWQVLADDWKRRDGLLVAILDGATVGYVSMMLNMVPSTAWATDLAVAPTARRLGIGSSLVLAAQEWARFRDCRRLVLEMQPKNAAAIGLARKLGFDFCGFHDSYYANRDIALFFAKSVR